MWNCLFIHYSMALLLTKSLKIFLWHLIFLFIIMVGMNYVHKAPPTTHEHRHVYVETMYGLKCCF